MSSTFRAQKSTDTQSVQQHTKPTLWIVGLWLIGLLVTAVLTTLLHNYQRERLHNRFGSELQRVSDDITRRFQTPVYGLMGARGVYAATGSVNRQQFRRYVESRNLAAEFPGVRGVGFIERVRRSELDDFVLSEQTDGRPDFAVRSLGSDRADLYVIKLIEPLSRNQSALGLDVGSEEVRREGAERAASSGQAALSGVIRLVQDNQSRPGFLLFVPVYRLSMPLNTPEERLAALNGLTYSTIVLEELLQPSLNSLRSSGLSIQIYEKPIVEGGQLLYETGNAPSKPLLSAEVPLLINGTSLVIRAQSTPFMDSTTNRPLVYGLGTAGGLLSTLLCWVLWLQATGRVRAEVRAQQMTLDLQKLAMVAEHTANAVVMTDANLRIIWVNEGFTRVCGFTLDDALGRTPGELLGSGLADPATLKQIKESSEQGVACRVEILNRAKDGHLYWLDTEVQPIRDTTGQLIGFIEIGLDVTQVRETHQRLKQALSESETQKQELDFLARVARETTNAVILTDPDGLIEWTNEGFTRITGYTLDECVGQTPGKLLQCPETDPHIVTHIREALALRQPCKAEILNRGKDGRRYWLELEITPLFGEGGRHTGFMAIQSDVTDRHETVERLKRAVQENESLMRAISQGTIYSVADLQGNIVDLNDEFVRISGYEREELIGSNHRLLKSGLQTDDFWTNAWATISSGQIWRGEVCNRNKHGQLYWVDSTIVPFVGLDGMVEKYISIRTDVTEQKRAQIELESQRKRLDNILKGTRAGTWEWHVPSGHIIFNERWADILGYTIEELEPTTIDTWMSLVHADDIGSSNEAMRRHFDGEMDYFKAEFRMRHSSGRWVWVQARGQLASREADGSPGWMYGTKIDITNQRERERRIAADEMRLRAVYDILPVGISITDPEGHIIDCNPASEQLLCISKADHLMRNYDDKQWVINREDGTPMPVEEFASVRALTQKTGVHDQVMQIVNGPHSAWLSVSAMPVHHEDFGVVIAYVDITHQKAQADALLAAKHQAEHASLFKSQFLANMSHEIRTPMNAILGMLTLMHNTSLAPRQLDYVVKTEGAAKSLLGLLNDILDLSKVEAGKMVLDPQPFDLDRLMRDLSVIFSSSVGNKPVEVLFDIDPRVPRKLLGDSLRLQQILINLGGNAIKFTSHGEIVLQVRLESLEGEAPQEQARVHFSMKDSGIGIAPENQHKIFAGFTQAEASTTRRFGGTGLGLSICRRLIELMGGQLRLESVEGSGSTFSFSIALPVADTTAIAIKGSSSSLATTADGSIPGLRVLVVDDNPVARELMAKMGASLGWRLDTAESGEAALARIALRTAQDEPYQAVFVDWLMPGLDGWQTSSHIRSLVAGGNGPDAALVIMMVTAHGREMLAQQTTEVQNLIDGYLVKPVTASMLFEAMQLAIQPKSIASNIRSTAQVAQPLKGLRILVVEDNAINQQVAEELLGGQGAAVDIADNGLRGIEAVQAAMATGKPYNVVLMDMQMPVMDGLSAAREIRERLGVRSLPIIAMTANAMASDREACLAVGMNDHIGKPFNLDQLVATLLQWTHGETAARASGAPIAEATEDIAVLNRTDALERMGGSTSLLNRMSSQFLADLPGYLQACELSALDEQRELTQRALHSLKGMAATIGADSLAKLAGREERNSRSGSTVNLEQLRQMAVRTEQALFDIGVAAKLASDDEVQQAPDHLDNAVPVRTVKGPNFVDIVNSPAELPDDTRALIARSPQPYPANEVAQRTWPAVAGIDVVEAQHRLGGDWKLFISILQRFTAENKDLMTAPVMEPASHGREALASRMHKLRGSSGALAATEVHRLATELEVMLVRSDAQALAGLQALACELVILIESVEPLLAAQRAGGNSAQPHATAHSLTAAELQELVDLLEASDLAAWDRFDDLRPAVTAKLGVSAAEDLYSAIMSLEFEQALRILVATERD